MAVYVQPIDLHVDKENLFQTVFAKQGDYHSRFVRVTMYEKDVKIVPEAGASANIRALKPDGTGIFNPCVINEDGTITAELTDQMLAVEGTVTGDIMLIGAENEILSAASFQVRVAPIPAGEVIESSNEFLVLIKLRGAVDAALAAAEAVATVYVSIELLPDQWTGDTAPYTCTVPVEGMTADKKVIVGLFAGADSETRAAARAAVLSCVAQGEGTLSFVADGRKPAISLPVTVREEGQ